MNLELNIIDERIKKCLIEKYSDGNLFGIGGIHYIFRFPNNYGASVVKGSYTYGGDKDLWEMALLYFYNATNDYELVYEKDFEDDVNDYLTTSQVNELLEKIMNYDENSNECYKKEPEENEPEEIKRENTMNVIKEITLSNGKVVRVLEAEGYNDGYYWDMSATVEIDGNEYTIQDAGSGSGYDPIFQSMSKFGPCKLTGVKLTPINEADTDWCCNWGYIFSAIEGIAEDFFASNAKESYEYYDDTYGDYSTHVDGVKVGAC